jgi:hypothetical protein
MNPMEEVVLLVLMVPLTWGLWFTCCLAIIKG